MTRSPKTLLTTTGVAVAFATTLTLGGCFASPVDQLANQLSDTLGDVQQGVEGLEDLKGLEGAQELVKKLTGGDVDVEAGATIPADFPREVPIVDGQIQSAITMTIEGQDTWTIMLLVPDTTAAMNLARQQLVSAGFAESAWSDAPLPFGMFTNAAYIINLSSIGSDDDHTVTYQVIQQPAG